MLQKRTMPCSFLLFLKEWAAAANSTFPTAFTRPPRATKSSPPTSGKLLSLSCGLSLQREGRIAEALTVMTSLLDRPHGIRELRLCLFVLSDLVHRVIS